MSDPFRRLEEFMNKIGLILEGREVRVIERWRAK
jgi:hypothetical protein